MSVIYICCTSVSEKMLLYHLKNLTRIKIKLLVTLDSELGAAKAGYRSFSDLKDKVKVKRVRSINCESVIEEFKRLNPSLIIQSGWSEKFNDELLSLPKYGCIGVHPSKLPAGKGAACLNWALIHGYENWGNTFYRMTNKYDDGQILDQREFNISERDTIETLYEKISQLSEITIKEKLSNWVTGKFDVVVPTSEPSYFGKRTPSDGELRKNMSIVEIDRYVRALSRPFPGAYVRLDETTIVKLWALDNNVTRSLDTKSKIIRQIHNLFFTKDKLYIRGLCGNYSKVVDWETQVILGNNVDEQSNIL